jgi:hypothetical protein
MVAMAAAALASPLNSLDGRWTGYGSIVTANGASESVKCQAVYQVREAGGTVHQNLRCASAGYNIDATALLNVSSGEVSGRWEERTFAASGSVSGRVTGSGINLSIQGPSFSAAMAVATTACKQSISIAPRGLDIARIAIGLGKC